MFLWKDEQNGYTKLNKKRRERTQIINISKENKRLLIQILQILKDNNIIYEQLYDTKYENLDEIGNFFEKYILPKLSQNETEKSE